MRILTDAQIREIAERHERARVEVRPIEQVTLEHPGMTIDDAYAAQQAWVDLQIAGGARLVGRKIGLTSVAMQQQMNIDEPDFGALLDYMVLTDGAAIDTARHVDPRLEVEVAFVLAHPLRGDALTVVDVLRATEYVLPALELIDARSHRVDPASGRARTVVDTVADNAADAGVILGGRPMAPGEVDLRWVGAILSRNGVVEETGLAAGVLNHPALGIAWLARRLAPYGLTLEPGQLVLSGSFTRAVAAKRGDTFTADYGPLGTVSCHFV
jgi:2-oxo-hept-3-ene-1,7-dioate hydratase